MNLIEILINEPFKLTIQSLLMMVNLLKLNEEKPTGILKVQLLVILVAQNQPKRRSSLSNV